MHIESLDNWFHIEFNDNPLEYAGNLYLNGSLVTSVTVPENITSIPSNVFSGCTCIKKVNIPDSVKSIGEGAFNACVSLENISIPDSVTSIGDSSFSGCASMTEITLPDSVTYIGECAFSWCDKLENIYIGSNVQEIGRAAFCRCPALKNITVDTVNAYYLSEDGVLFNKNKTSLICYPSGKTSSNYEIPSSVKEVEYGAFIGNTYIESVVVPDSVNSMGYGVFGDCLKLKTVVLGDSLTEIPGAAFLCCYNLSSVNFGENIIAIGEDAFTCCENLTLIDIPNSVTTIGDYAFSSCINLTEIKLPEKLEIINEDVFFDCESLKSITIPKNVTSIERSAFRFCDDLEYVFYTGSESDWGIITIDSNNTNLTNAVIHYNSTDHTCEYKIDTEATCTQDGSKHQECVVCGYSLENEVIPSHGHTYSTEWIVDVAPTCTEAGSKSHHCTVCGEKKDITVIAATGHNYEITNVVSAHPHTTLYKCSYCDDEKTETPVISNCVECIYGTETPIKGTEKTEIDFNNLIIKTSIQNCNEVTKLLGVSETASVVITASYKHGNIELYGTGTIITVYDGDECVGDFTLVVNGDLNGDSVCDVLDCADVEKASNGNAELSGTYAMAADSNSDDIVDITDYQSIVNKALAS